MTEETVAKALRSEGGRALIQEIIEDARLLEEAPGGFDVSNERLRFHLGMQVTAKQLKQHIERIENPPNEDQDL